MTKKIKASVEELIEAVKEYPVLYDRANNVSGAQTNEEKAIAWKKIADLLDDDVNYLKSKWRNLRDSYQKAVKNRKELEEIGQLHRYHEYKHEEKLEFLYNHLDLEPPTKKRKASSCYSPSSKSIKSEPAPYKIETNSQEPSNYQSIEYLEECPVEQQDEEEHGEILNREEESENNFCYEIDEQQPQHSNILTAPKEPQSEIDAWLQTLKFQMLKLNKLNQARAKRDINEILSNYEINEIEQSQNNS